MRSTLTFAGVLAALSLVPAQNLRAQEHGVPAPPAALVVFQPPHADLSVVGWDRDSVRIVVRQAGPIRVEMERITGGVQIHERRPLSAAGARPTYELFVPRNATVRVTVVLGTVTLRGLGGTIRAGVADGSLRADSIAGRAELSTATGPLELRNGRGRLDVRSVAGDVVLLDVSGGIRARTTSGVVRISLARQSLLEAESYSGMIEFTGPLGGGTSSFATHSGDIRLQLPGRGDATLFVTAVQARAVIECGSGRQTPVRGEPLPLGAGGDPIEIVTFTGSVRVSCRR